MTLTLSMALLMVLCIYAIKWLGARQQASHLPHLLVLGSFGSILLLGVLALTFIYDRYEQTDKERIGAVKKAVVKSPCPQYGQVAIKYRGQTWCTDEMQVTHLKNGQVSLLLTPSGSPPDATLFKLNIAHNKPPHLQGIAAAEPERKDRSGLLNRYAEIVYFLALVLGVLSSFYMSWYEERKKNPELKFDHNQVVVSFILAVLVYVSVYSTIEKDKGIATTGLLACFQNGFFWQSIMKNRMGGESKEEGKAA